MITHLKLHFRLLPLLLLLPLSTYAQDFSGADTLQKAADLYGQARFSEAELVLEQSYSEFKFVEEIRCLRFMAMIHLAKDELELARADIRSLLDLNPDYNSSFFDDKIDLREEIARVRSSGSGLVTYSVSKKAEDRLKAPATVLVISAEQIERRGYTDLIELISDLPGFDVSRIFAATYANVYQRGFRSVNTERTLFLVDGIEENDLWTNIAFISRQYPLSNIQAVEVVYGPASTMYGPNAFVGVINVITKNAQTMLQEGQKIGVQFSSGYGNWNTRFADLSVAGKFKNISFRLTGRSFASDEMDLSGEVPFNYSPAVYFDPALDYKSKLSITETPTQYLQENGMYDSLSNRPLEHPFYDLHYDADSNLTGIQLNDRGDSAARSLDAALMEVENLNGASVGYTNHSNNWLVNGLLSIGELNLGFQTWYREEGINPYYVSNFSAGSRNGSVWVPNNSFFYAQYQKQFNPKLSLFSLLNYRTHTLHRNTRITSASSYWRGGLQLKDLAPGNGAAPAVPSWITSYYFQKSNQLRFENRLIYRYKPNLDFIGGLEVRNSLMQGDYLISRDTFPAQDAGTFRGTQLGGNQYTIWDASAYAQGTYRPLEQFQIVFGARFDYNRIRTSEGFGGEISPRIVLVYAPGAFVFKGIYARGIQNVSNFTKYSNAGIRVANPDLETEKINNLETSLSFRPNRELLIDAQAYLSLIEDVVRIKQREDGNEQNENLGEFEIFGIQANVNWDLGPVSLFGNYTFTHPFQSSPDSIPPPPYRTRVGDIASHQIHLGGNVQFLKRINLNLRGNWVGERLTGTHTLAGSPQDTLLLTTVPDNPIDRVPAFFLLNGTLTFQDLFVKGLDLQLTVNNILDQSYTHPGPRTASGQFYVSEIRQRSRHVFIRLNYQF